MGGTVRHVIENATQRTRYYVADGVAYDIETHKSRFRIVGVYWFTFPSGAGLPVMIEHNGWLYDYPPDQPPVFFLA